MLFLNYVPSSCADVQLHTSVSIPKYGVFSSYLFLICRLAALECVMILAQVHNDADKNDVVFRHQVGDVIMFFLPGIISGLQRIATADEKQGHQITVV